MFWEVFVFVFLYFKRKAWCFVMSEICTAGSYRFIFCLMLPSGGAKCVCIVCVHTSVWKQQKSCVR